MDTTAALADVAQISGALQILAALNLTADIFLPSAFVRNGASYDYVIVGGGTAGCVVANRLTEDPNTSVLLIEAGGDPPLASIFPALMLNLPKTSSAWNYTSEYSKPEPQCSGREKTDLMLSKVLGGTGALNYMLYSQAKYKDFDSWASASNDPTWKWKHVLHYMIKAEKVKDKEIMNSPDAAFHGFNGPIGLKKDRRAVTRKYMNSFKDVGKNVVSDVNVHKAVGYTEAMYNIVDGFRQSTAYTYVTPIKDRPNLHVSKYTSVSKIIFNKNKNAIGVEAVVNGNKKIVIKARKEVIVSAGAINTPKLLMLSGIGPKEHLRSKDINVVSDLPVGRNLQDHAATILIHNMTKLVKPPGIISEYLYVAYSFNGFVSLNNCDYPDYETLNYINYSKDLLKYCSIAYESTNTICDCLFKTLTNTQIMWTMVTNLRPKSRGHVLLRSANYEDSPMVYTELFSNQEDLNNQVRYIKDFIEIGNTTFFRANGGVLKKPRLPNCNCTEYENEEYWKCYALCVMTPLRRYCGTCAMGSVVDGKLRVRGVRRLRVVDASVMPTIPSGGTYGPTVVIAEKAADMIKKDL